MEDHNSIRPDRSLSLGRQTSKWSYGMCVFFENNSNQFNYDYVKLKIGYFSNRIPVWEGIFTLENLT